MFAGVRSICLCSFLFDLCLLVFGCVRSCSTCVRSCSTCVRSCSTCIRSCSTCVRSCSLVFGCVRSCSVVFSLVCYFSTDLQKLSNERSYKFNLILTVKRSSGYIFFILLDAIFSQN